MKAFLAGELEVEFQKKTSRPWSHPYYWNAKKNKTNAKCKYLWK